MTAPTEPTPAAPAPAPTPQPAVPAAPAQPAAPAAPFDPASLTPEAQEYIRKQIDDANYKARTTARTTAAQEARDQLVQDLAKALGISTPDEPLDPAKLTEQLGQSRQQWQAAEEHAASLEVERDVIRAAIRVGADPDKLLDSQRFCDEIDNLDFTDEADFLAKVEAKIKAAVEKDPTLRLAGQASARIGADLTGGPGGAGARPTSIRAAVDSAYQRR